MGIRLDRRDGLRAEIRLDLEALLHPANAFSTPSAVVCDPDLTLSEKRAILASWASDACAVESAPALPSYMSPYRLFSIPMDAALILLPRNGSSDSSLGPAFSEEQVKATLDNCRLTYIYEPEWSRLFDRVSRLLDRGTLVAWFQGALGFGPRGVAGRAILCDPSNRWARENVNRFLRQVPVDTPLPLAVMDTAEAWPAGQVRRFAVQTPTVPPAWRDRLAAVEVNVRDVPRDRTQLHPDVAPHEVGRVGAPAGPVASVGVLARLGAIWFATRAIARRRVGAVNGNRLPPPREVASEQSVGGGHRAVPPSRGGASSAVAQQRVPSRAVSSVATSVSLIG